MLRLYRRAEMMYVGGLFQAVMPETGKARSPKLEIRHGERPIGDVRPNAGWSES
jgi:hypothetical protein